MLDRGAALNTSNQPSKFRTKKGVEINDESRGTYSVNRQINFKTSMLRSSLCDYSDAYILVTVNMSVNNTAADGAAAKKVIFKNFAPLTDCKRNINNTQIDNVNNIDTVILIYNVIGHSKNY